MLCRDCLLNQYRESLNGWTFNLSANEINWTNPEGFSLNNSPELSINPRVTDFRKIHSVIKKVQRRKALFHLYLQMSWQSSTLIKLYRTDLEKPLCCLCKYTQVSLAQFAAYQERQTSNCVFILCSNLTDIMLHVHGKVRMDRAAVEWLFPINSLGPRIYNLW